MPNQRNAWNVPPAVGEKWKRDYQEKYGPQQIQGQQSSSDSDDSSDMNRYADRYCQEKQGDARIRCRQQWRNIALREEHGDGYE